MDCHYISLIETNFKNYLEEIAEEDNDKIYKWKFYRNMPRVVFNIDVKNISFSGNKELVFLKAMTFFDEKGINFYQSIFEFALKELKVKSINDYKELEKDEFFSFMVDSIFDCEGPRLFLVEFENDDSCLEEEEESEEEDD